MTKYYIGKTFTANPAGVVSNPKSTTAYQWLSESLPITGETSSTYATSITDENKQLQVRQIETNRFGFDSAVSSAVEVNTSSYGITDTEPYILCDFLNDYYRKGYADSTFDSVCDYSTTTLSTVFDSTGTLVWAPHNFVPYSNDFTTGWSTVYATVTTDAISAFGLNGIKLVSGDGDPYHELKDVLPVSSVPRRLRVIAKAAEWSWMFISHDGPNANVYYDLENGVVGAQNAGGVGEITALGDGWYACDLITPNWTNGRNTFIRACNANNNTSITGDGVSGIYILSVNQWDDRLPMADNPDAPDAALPWYVETTGTTKYLSRRNAHYYNGTAWVNGGLQLESAATTNLCPNSQDLNGTGWTSTVVVTDAQGTGPDGTLSLQNLNDNTTSLLETSCTVTAVNGTKYVASFYVEKDTDETRFPEFYIYDTANGAAYHFNTKTGATTLRATSGTPSGNSIAVEDHGDLWFVYLTLTAQTTSMQLVIRPACGTTFGVFTAGATGSINAGFVQIETGSLPTSYIPTAGSSATRAAQTLTVDYSDIIDIGGVKMQGQITFTDQDTPTQHTFWRRYKDADEYISVTMDTDSSTNAELNFIQSNGANVGAVVLSTEYAPGILTHYNFSSSHGTNTINGHDGTDTGTADTTSNTLPTFTTQDLNIGYDYSGNISAFAIFENTLSDSLLGEASVDYSFWLYGDNINTTGLWVDSTSWD